MITRGKARTRKGGSTAAISLELLRKRGKEGERGSQGREREILLRSSSSFPGYFLLLRSLPPSDFYCLPPPLSFPHLGRSSAVGPGPLHRRRDEGRPWRSDWHIRQGSRGLLSGNMYAPIRILAQYSCICKARPTHLAQDYSSKRKVFFHYSV